VRDTVRDSGRARVRETQKETQRGRRGERHGEKDAARERLRGGNEARRSTLGGEEGRDAAGVAAGERTRGVSVGGVAGGEAAVSTALRPTLVRFRRKPIAATDLNSKATFPRQPNPSPLFCDLAGVTGRDDEATSPARVLILSTVSRHLATLGFNKTDPQLFRFQLAIKCQN
jgi:hypothetical protein